MGSPGLTSPGSARCVLVGRAAWPSAPVRAGLRQSEIPFRPSAFPSFRLARCWEGRACDRGDSNSQGLPHRILNPFIRSDGTVPVSITRKNHHDLRARRRNRFPVLFGPFRFRTGTQWEHTDVRGWIPVSRIVETKKWRTLWSLASAYPLERRTNPSRQFPTFAFNSSNQFSTRINALAGPSSPIPAARTMRNR